MSIKSELHNYIKPSRLFMYIFMYLIVTLVLWVMDSDRNGQDLALIAGAVLVPIIGMFKYILEWSDRNKKN